jgi:hypothetical protein
MDGWTDMTIPVCILFLQAVRRLYNNPNETKLTSIEQAGVVIMLKTCVWEVLSFWPHLEHWLSRDFSWFTSVPPYKCQDSILVRTRLLPSKCFPIHHSAVILWPTISRYRHHLKITHTQKKSDVSWQTMLQAGRSRVRVSMKWIFFFQFT